MSRSVVVLCARRVVSRNVLAASSSFGACWRDTQLACPDTDNVLVEVVGGGAARVQRWTLRAHLQCACDALIAFVRAFAGNEVVVQRCQAGAGGAGGQVGAEQGGDGGG